jgi:hypothetical protein
MFRVAYGSANAVGLEQAFLYIVTILRNAVTVLQSCHTIIGPQVAMRCIVPQRDTSEV